MSVPHPTGPNMAAITIAQPAQEIDIERKQPSDDVTELNDDLKSDSSSERKQDGVKKVEAVTSVWTKKTLWLMFVL
jgi:hypothetical protein